MNNPNGQFPFNYDPNAVYDNALLNGLSLQNSGTNVDPNANQMAANFYNYGLSGFADPLSFSNCELIFEGALK